MPEMQGVLPIERSALGSRDACDESPGNVWDTIGPSDAGEGRGGTRAEIPSEGEGAGVFSHESVVGGGIGWWCGGDRAWGIADARRPPVEAHLPPFARRFA